MIESCQIVVFITNFDFSRQISPGFSRLINYSKAIGSDHLMVIWLSTKFDYRGKISIVIKEEHMELISDKVFNYKSTFEDFHFIINYLSLNNSFKYLFRKYKIENVSSVLLYPSTLSLVIVSLLFFKLKYSIRLLIEKNELKSAISLNRGVTRKTFLKPINNVLIKPLLYLTGLITDALAVFFDGIIVISTRFELLYKRFNKNIIRIPILASDDLISNESQDSSQHNANDLFKIGYFGWISEKKDGVISLINSIINLNGIKYNNFCLDLYGPSTIETISLIERLCRSHPFIRYHGSIPGYEIAPILKRFDLLAFPRPLNLQTKFGFSTKLAEFMLSGVPVLTSSVSDTKLFIHDGISGFLVESSNVVDVNMLSEKLVEIRSLDKNKLSRIGKNAREIALLHFNPYQHADALIRFFKSK